VRRIFIILVVALAPFALHAIWDQVEASLLARTVRDLELHGEPISLRDQRSALPTAEERKAARLYAAAAELAQGSARDNPDARLHRPSVVIQSSLSQPGLDARLDDLQRQYVDGQAALDLLDLATPLTFGGFGPASSDMNGGGLTELNLLNLIRADIASARRQPDLAAARVTESIRLQRTMPAGLYESWATARTFESLRLLLLTNVLTVSSLDGLQHAYEDTPNGDRAVSDLEMGRARILGDFWPYPPASTSWAFRLKPPSRSGVLATLTFVAFRPLITHRFRRMLQPFDEAIAAAKLPWPKNLDAADALARRYSIDPVQKTFPKPSFASRIGFFEPYLAPANLVWGLPSTGLTLARRNVALAILAIERYRRNHAETPPADLAALVPAYLKDVPMDPFTGTPVKYRLQRDGYVVYSVDVDRKDDGGVLYGAYTSRSDGVFDRGVARDAGIRVPFIEPNR
jgi:hypothetical protein